MKILIALNFAVGIALVGVFNLPDRYLFPLGMVVVPIFLFGLPIANIVYVFIAWKHERAKTFIPLASCCFAFLLAFFLGRTIADMRLKRTPCRPDSFFDAQKKRDLTEMANRVLDDRRRGGSQNIQELGINYGGLAVALDTNQNLVVFNCRRGRLSFQYIFAPNGSTNQLYNVDITPIQKNLGDGWYFRTY